MPEASSVASSLASRCLRKSCNTSSRARATDGWCTRSTWFVGWSHLFRLIIPPRSVAFDPGANRSVSARTSGASGRIRPGSSGSSHHQHINLGCGFGTGVTIGKASGTQVRDSCSDVDHPESPEDPKTPSDHDHALASAETSKRPRVGDFPIPLLLVPIRTGGHDPKSDARSRLPGSGGRRKRRPSTVVSPGSWHIRMRRQGPSVAHGAN